MRRISVLGVGVVLVFLMLSGCKAKEVVESSPVPPAKAGKAGYGVLWESEVTSGQAVRDAFIIGENIYIETKTCELYAVDRENGHTRWIVGLAGPLKARPLMKGKSLWAVTASLLIEIDTKKGYIVREEPLGFSPSSGVAIDDYNFYISGWDGRLYTLEQKTFKTKATSPLKGCVLASPRLAQNLVICATEEGFIQAVRTLDGSTDWFFPERHILHRIRAKELWAGDVVAEDLISTDGKVILEKGIPANVATLNAIEENEIEEVWIYVSKGAYELPTRTQFVGQVEEVGGTIYAATTDSMLYSLRTRGGNLLWWANLPGPAISGVIVRGDTIFVPTYESGLVALDKESGRRKWWVEDVLETGLLAFGQGKIYLLGQGEVIMAVDETSGKLLFSFPLPQAKLGLTNLDSEVLYLFTPQGFLQAVKEKSKVPSP